MVCVSLAGRRSDPAADPVGLRLCRMAHLLGPPAPADGLRSRRPNPRRPLFRATLATGKVFVLALGDSITRGYGATRTSNYVSLLIQNDDDLYPDMKGPGPSHGPAANGIPECRRRFHHDRRSPRPPTPEDPNLPSRCLRHRPGHQRRQRPDPRLRPIRPAQRRHVRLHDRTGPGLDRASAGSASSDSARRHDQISRRLRDLPGQPLRSHRRRRRSAELRPAPLARRDARYSTK